MAAQGAPLNTDDGGKLTSGYYGDRGDGTSNWHNVTRVYDGGDEATGATDDSAVTNPASSGSVVALLKGLLSKLTAGATTILKLEDAAHASGDAGVAMLAVRRDSASVGSSAAGDYSTVNVDADGRVYVLAKRDPDDTLSLTANTALADDLVVKASAGTLHSIVGYVASGEAGWIQVHDATSQPSDTAVPEMSFYVDASSAHQAVNIPLPGHACATGITLAWSTTGPTLTSGAAKMMLTGYYE